MREDQDIAAYYASLLREHGPTHRAGDHGSAASQAKRLDILTEPAWSQTARQRTGDNVSVLDVGCGTGAMTKWLPWWVTSYEGWDFSGDLVQAAQAQWDADKPEWVSPRATRFVQRDLMHAREQGVADYVFASGLFQFRDREYLGAAVLRMWNLCRLGIGFNALMSTSDTGEYAHDPTFLLAFASTISPKVVVRTDYLPNDVTVYVYRP